MNDNERNDMDCDETGCQLPAGHDSYHQATIHMPPEGDEPTDQMQRLAFQLAMHAVDHEVEELKKHNRRNRRLTWSLVFAVAVNVGVGLVNLGRLL